MPRPGAFVPFADPGDTALDAKVFWRADDSRRVISGNVRDVRDRGFGSVVSLKGLRCHKALLKTADGTQHVLLQNDRQIAQLRCTGDEIRTGSFSLELVADRFPDVESGLRRIKAFADIYRDRTTSGSSQRWTVEAIRHRDALAALDRRMEGRSYREIAVFLYGEKAVGNDWNNPDQTMKNRVIRSVKRGVRMMKGDYRTLLS